MAVTVRVIKQRKREEIVKDIIFNLNPNERLQIELLLDIRELLQYVAKKETMFLE